MNNYNCEIVADSLNTFGNRITTFKLTYPRIIHSELMTHRVFSRNAASSRAVPVKKMIESVRNNMFTPLAVQKAHKGMQGSDYFEGVELEQAKQLWIESAELAIQQAEKMEKFGITKQLINRILEPYQYYQVLVTATEYDNFFELRCPKYQTPVSQTVEPQYSWKDLMKVHSNPDNLDLLEKNKDNYTFKFQHSKSSAEIHIQALAESMWDAVNDSTPKQLKAGEWHIVYQEDIVKELKAIGKPYSTMDVVKIATAWAARISFTVVGKGRVLNVLKDIDLHDDLIKKQHWSPPEHCARAMTVKEYNSSIRGEVDPNEGIPNAKLPKEIKGWCRNFKGFKQYRTFVD